MYVNILTGSYLIHLNGKKIPKYDKYIVPLFDEIPHINIVKKELKLNNREKLIYILNRIFVPKELRGKGISINLISKTIEHMLENNIGQLYFEPRNINYWFKISDRFNIQLDEKLGILTIEGKLLIKQILES